MDGKGPKEKAAVMFINIIFFVCGVAVPRTTADGRERRQMREKGKKFVEGEGMEWQKVSERALLRTKK